MGKGVKSCPNLGDVKNGRPPSSLKKPGLLKIAHSTNEQLKKNSLSFSKLIFFETFGQVKKNDIFNFFAFLFQINQNHWFICQYFAIKVLRLFQVFVAKILFWNWLSCFSY